MTTANHPLVRRGYPIWYYDGEGARYPAKIKTIQPDGGLTLLVKMAEVDTIEDVALGGYHDEGVRAVLAAPNDPVPLEEIEDYIEGELLEE